jgi:small neutral amino acid transporter SnatA (MarC family)
MTHPLFTISFALFLLMDAIGNVPIYISVLRDIEPKRQRIIIIRELFIALGVIILFAFFGQYLLDILNVKQETVLLAGGIILFIIALKMIFPDGSNFGTSGTGGGEPFIVPLAIPLIAGPSILAAVIIYSHEVSSLILIASICIAWGFSTLILFASPFLKKVLGLKGISACEKLMGLILTLMAVQMFLEGITLFLKAHP